MSVQKVVRNVYNDNVEVYLRKSDYLADLRLGEVEVRIVSRDFDTAFKAANYALDRLLKAKIEKDDKEK